jgi:hypothetical protein
VKVWTGFDWYLIKYICIVSFDKCFITIHYHEFLLANIFVLACKPSLVLSLPNISQVTMYCTNFIVFLDQLNNCLQRPVICWIWESCFIRCYVTCILVCRNILKKQKLFYSMRWVRWWIGHLEISIQSICLKKRSSRTSRDSRSLTMIIKAMSPLQILGAAFRYVLLI